MSDRGDSGSPAPKAYAWYVFSLVFMQMIFVYIDGQIIASLIPFLCWGQCAAPGYWVFNLIPNNSSAQR